MLTAEAAALAVKVGKGIVKLSRRLDLILAEKEVVEEPLAIPVPNVKLGPTQPQMRKALRQLLKDTENESPDPLGEDRKKILETVEENPQNPLLFAFLKKYLPEQALGRVLSLEGDFITALREQHPEIAADADLRVTAFYVKAGRDFRNKDYSWRIALTVVDVLAEFGGENMALFTRDERVQKIVGAILQRFGEADLQKTDSTRELLRTALASSLNAVFEVREAYNPENQWIKALLDALATARDALPEEEREDFLVGLFHGKGYPPLVSAVLEVAAGRLDEDDAVNFKDVAADLLQETAVMIKANPTFEDFFEDHWGDLLRAGLRSVEAHGPGLLRRESPLLKKVLISVAGELATEPDHKLLSTDALVGMVEAAVGAVAANPELVKEKVDEKWLAELMGSVAETLARKGIRNTFTRQGLENLLRDTLATFARHPELIVEEPGLARELLGDVLESLSRVESFVAEDLATAAVGGALSALADNPSLVKFRYPELVVLFAGKIGSLVKEKKLTRVQGSEVLAVVTSVVGESPEVFLQIERDLANWAVDAVIEVSHGNESGLLAGATLARVLRNVLSALAQSGKAALKSHPTEDLTGHLMSLLNAGLARTEKELGNLIHLPILPVILGDLVVSWARGEIAVVDPEDDNFRRLFSQLAMRAYGRET